jgi:hypothetical protein
LPDEVSLMIGLRMTADWAPAILAVFALLFAPSPVTAMQTSSTPMAMLMAPADACGSDTPAILWR